MGHLRVEERPPHRCERERWDMPDNDVECHKRVLGKVKRASLEKLGKSSHANYGHETKADCKSPFFKFNRESLIFERQAPSGNDVFDPVVRKWDPTPGRHTIQSFRGKEDSTVDDFGSELLSRLFLCCQLDVVVEQLRQLRRDREQIAPHVDRTTFLAKTRSQRKGRGSFAQVELETSCNKRTRRIDSGRAGLHSCGLSLGRHI
mmetsp:Transcript_21079/g.49294  ORF Transcript_21079/g.49294 Transcript_21079/m.49294 type:complete len:204 (+) Transcript_21079:1929-2540(+)